MSVAPITPGGSSPAGIGLPQAEPSRAGGTAFTQMIEHLLEGTAAQDAKASQAVQDLATGKEDNLHNVMLTVAKADLNFRLILEIRNRLTDAFQEVMRMQY